MSQRCGFDKILLVPVQQAPEDRLSGFCMTCFLPVNIQMEEYDILWIAEKN